MELDAPVFEHLTNFHGIVTVVVHVLSDHAVPIGQGAKPRCGTGQAGRGSARSVIDAKLTGDRGSWWLEEAFRGH